MTSIEQSPMRVLPGEAPRPQQPLLLAQGAPSASRALVRTIFRKCGVDRAIAYTLIGRCWNIIAGPLTLVLIARFLRPDEQGFYYTFGSVLALNVFFELGLGYVLLQFASHEKAHLDWTSSVTLYGPEVATKRLAALFKMALRWYTVAVVLALALGLPAGLFFFSQSAPSNVTVAWRIPWIWLATVCALNILVAPLFAILEGCGKISDIASMRIGQSVLANAGLWLVLVCHGALFAGAVFQTITFTFGIAWLILRYGRFFRSLLKTDVTQAHFQWWSEVWPLQWRIALSWLSGYFIFQLFNPVLFAYHGPVVAGQMGMCLSLCNALLGMSVAWISTKMSPFGVLVARRQWAALDSAFFKTLRESILVLLAAAVVVYACVVILNYRHHSFSKRLLNPVPFAFILLATVMNHVVFCEAYYLRTHKAEPFLVQSIVIGVLTGSSTFLLARPFSALGVSAGYLICCALGLVWGTRTFQRKRREWHA